MYRKGVSAIIQNSKSEFLFVNLVTFEEKYYALPGGGLEIGEELLEAAYREIKEELGISKESLVYVGKSAEPLKFEFESIIDLPPNNYLPHTKHTLLSLTL